MQNLIKVASAEIGVKEIPGKRSNPKILEYAKEAGFKGYKSDEIAWCSLFANWVAFKCGLERSNSLWAKSWLNVGVEVHKPEYGDVIVLHRGKRKSHKGHVGFFQGFSEDKARVYCLGGNQKNMVSTTAKPVDQVVGYRRLRPISQIDFSSKELKNEDLGTEVACLQDALKLLGYNCGTSDGVFGPKTEQCLEDFQSTDESMDINGVFDKATRDFLKKILKTRLS